MYRKRREEEHENTERWLVSYADFITLLFAFFVVLYATSSRNDEKEKQFEDSVRQYMKLVAISGNAGGPQNGNSGSTVIDPIERIQVKGVANDEMANHIVKILEKNVEEKDRNQHIKGVKHELNGVRISLAASSFFPEGSAKIKIPAMRVLEKVGDVIAKTPYKIIVEGHTDDKPLGSTQYESNWELASHRATRVVRFFNKVNKIDARRLAATSFGENRPIAPNTSIDNREKNRRVEIVISTREEFDE